MLDAYLKPFVRGPVVYEKLAESIARAPSIDGGEVAENEVLGEANERQGQYEAILAKRKRSEDE